MNPNWTVVLLPFVCLLGPNLTAAAQQAKPADTFSESFDRAYATINRLPAVTADTAAPTGWEPPPVDAAISSQQFAPLPPRDMRAIPNPRDSDVQRPELPMAGANSGLPDQQVPLSRPENPPSIVPPDEATFQPAGNFEPILAPADPASADPQAILPTAADNTARFPESDLWPVNRDPEAVTWWQAEVSRPLRNSVAHESLETNQLVYQAIQQSPRIRAVSQSPLIRQTQVSEAEAEFDPVSFVRSQFQDRVDPVGDNLSVTNDGSLFLDNHLWNADLGFRRKTYTGASVEFSQKLGFQNSNSAFFNPQDQGTATLAMNVSQPLMRGRGDYYNRSQIVIAEVNEGVAWSEFEVELQREIQETVEAYWQLYFDRTVYLQKQRNVQRANAIAEKLIGRSGLDSMAAQIARANSEVLARKTDLANAWRNVKNSETEIRRRTSNRDWQVTAEMEILPTEAPAADTPPMELEAVITTALENRSEIRRGLQLARIQAIRRDVRMNELLPELSFLIGTYVSALQGDSQLGDAFVDQFGSVKPGYSVGLEFQMPIGNRAANSRLRQQRLRLMRTHAEFDQTIQNVIAEAQVAHRRVVSARETLVAATEAIQAARVDMDQNIGRWESFAMIEGDLIEGRSPTTMLDQLLESQDRLSRAESTYAQAARELKIAETDLQRTMGTLLIRRQIDVSTSTLDDLPQIDLQHPSSATTR